MTFTPEQARHRDAGRAGTETAKLPSMLRRASSRPWVGCQPVLDRNTVDCPEVRRLKLAVKFLQNYSPAFDRSSRDCQVVHRPKHSLEVQMEPRHAFGQSNQGRLAAHRRDLAVEFRPESWLVPVRSNQHRQVAHRSGMVESLTLATQQRLAPVPAGTLFDAGDRCLRLKLSTVFRTAFWCSNPRPCDSWRNAVLGSPRPAYHTVDCSRNGPFQLNAGPESRQKK